MISNQDTSERLAILNNIEEIGWRVFAVQTDVETPNYAYTIGLFHSFGHPEVLMMGLPITKMHELLNLIGLLIKDGAEMENGAESSDILANHNCYFQSVHKRNYLRFFEEGIDFYGNDDFPVLQCVWPDSRGLYPWQDGVDSVVRRLQMMLSEPKASFRLHKELELFRQLTFSAEPKFDQVAEQAAALIDKGKALWAAGHLDESEDSFSNCYLEFGPPGHPYASYPPLRKQVARAMLNLMVTALHRNQKERVLELFEEIIERFQSDAELDMRCYMAHASHYAAQCFLKLERYEELFACVETSFEFYKRDPVAGTLRSMVRILEQFELAISPYCLRKVNTRVSDEEFTKMSEEERIFHTLASVTALPEIENEMKEWVESRRSFLFDSNQGGTLAVIARARKWLEDGKFDEAASEMRELYDELKSSTQSCEKYLINHTICVLILSLIQSKNHSEAARILYETTKENFKTSHDSTLSAAERDQARVDGAQYLLMCGIILQECCRTEEAQRAFQTAINQFESDPLDLMQSIVRIARSNLLV